MKKCIQKVELSRIAAGDVDRFYIIKPDEEINCINCKKEITIFWFCSMCLSSFCYDCLIDSRERCLCSKKKPLYNPEHQFIKCESKKIRK